MKNKNIYSQVSGLKYHAKVKFQCLKCQTESQKIKMSAGLQLQGQNVGCSR